MHQLLWNYILHGQSLTNQFQFLRYVILRHRHVPSCTVVAVYNIICTAALTANIWSTISLKSIPTGTAKILRNLLDIKTVPGVVGEIQIATTSSSIAANYSMATDSDTPVAFPESTTTTSSLSLPGIHLQESTFLLIIYLFIWKYLGDLTRQVGHCIKNLSMRIQENELTRIHYQILGTLIFSIIFLTIWFSKWILPFLFKIVKAFCSTVENFSKEYV